ncbi:amidohydrolase [Arenimonas fontis]|nr:amidohydrolase [Arenimonas fontis]
MAGMAAAADVTVLSAARIHTGVPGRPAVEAMAWDREGRILAIGDRARLLRSHPSARRIELPDATVIPGLIDGHAHLMNLGIALLRADLAGTADKAEVIARLRAFARNLPDGTWLLGRGWDQNDWPEAAFPTAADLDAAFPDRPVWLERVDGHAGWANSAALRAVGRDLSGDWQPEGGRILRGATGKPTGVLVDTAMALVDAVVPPPDRSMREEALRRALAAAASHGLTGVHDMGVSLADLELMRRFADQGLLKVRVRAYADGAGAAMEALCAMGPYEHPGGRLSMRGVKFYVDGALGSRGAALLADYSDEPGHRGLLITPPEAFQAAVQRARDCGLQPASHAIGDRGVRVVLDTYARVLGDDAMRGNHRWRVEHAQVIAREDMPRFGELQLIASMQPTHATSDMPWAGDRVGEARLQGAYAWRSLWGMGVVLALGSDFPVESVDPRLGLYAAVTRQDTHGQPPGGWRPQERLDLAEALKGFTWGAAYAAHDELELGQLHPGYRADFVVLAADPFAIDPTDLPRLPILSTWLDGKPTFTQPGSE